MITPNCFANVMVAYEFAARVRQVAGLPGWGSQS